jgi:hypothetical protein
VARQRWLRHGILACYAPAMRAAPWPFGNPEHAELLADIGRALGLDGPLPEWRTGSYTGGSDASDRTAPHGRANQVLTGLAEPGSGRVVWVEEHTGNLSDPEAVHYPDDFVDVMINLAGAGVQHLPRISQPGWIKRPGSPWICVALDDDRPDRVGEIPFLRFFGDDLVIVHEKGLGYKACRFAFRPAAVTDGQVLVDRVAAGMVCAVAEVPGQATLCLQKSVIRRGYSPLVHTLRLPDFAPEVPLPVPDLTEQPGGQFARVELHANPEGGVLRWAEKLQENEGSGWHDGRAAWLRLPRPGQSGFPSDRTPVWEQLRTVLASPQAPPGGADILIGAVTAPFWDKYVIPADRTSARHSRPAPTAVSGPCWFPAAWYHYLRTHAAQEEEAAAWLSWLDLLAAPDDQLSFTGWDSGWSQHEGIAQLALTHIRQRCRALAAACRAGEIPTEGSHPVPGKDWLHPRPLTAFPAGFARAWNRLPGSFRPSA